MLKNLIYKLKRAAQVNPTLYRVFYFLASFNLDYCRQLLQINQYPSKFGGMWTDREDFKERLACSSSDELEQKRFVQWREDGYLIMERAVAPELIDQYLLELERLKSDQPSPLLVTAATLKEPAIFNSEFVREHHSVRTVDDYFFSEASRNILLDANIMSFVESVFDAPPMLTQSLSFEHGSQQAIHQDTAFVRMNSPMKLAAIWVALEDVQSGSGELLYYPGSHRWEGYLFSDRFKHFDEERDGLDQLEQWHQWIEDEANRRGVERAAFLPKKGDVLVWHAGLAHGGALVEDEALTRKSLVGHYCPDNVRPLYHYYKPEQRKCYRHEAYSYCTSYYRRG